MSAPKLRRWVCPLCRAGKLAPSRPRRDDVRRYCLPCSAKTGRLVEKVAPSAERERAVSATATAAKRKAKASTAAKRRAAAKAAEKARLDARFVVRSDVTGEPVDLRREVGRVWRAARKVEPRLRAAAPTLVASHGGGSYAYTAEGKIHLGRDADWETLVHEVAHFVQARRGYGERSDGKRAVHDREFYVILRDVLEVLVPGFRASFYGVTGWGYAVDGLIRRQLRDRRETAGDAV